MKKTYHIVTRAARESAAVIEQFCQTNGQILLPIVNLIQNASQVVETVIHEVGHQMLEQILVLSAEQVAGARTPGKASGAIRHHGSQPGCVQLADRKVKVKRPRLRHKTEGEVKVPAYEALRQDRGLGQHMLGALLRGVSTREYRKCCRRWPRRWASRAAPSAAKRWRRAPSSSNNYRSGYGRTSRFW